MRSRKPRTIPGLHLVSACTTRPTANGDYPYGDFVVEIICATTINQQDAVLSCQGYTNNTTMPSVNDQITVTGPYVLYTDHSNWAEIHPVYSLTIS